MTLNILGRKLGPTVVPIAKVKQLGRVPPDLDYVTIDGQEYALLASVYDEAPDPRGQAGQVYVSIPRMVRDEDTGQTMQMGAVYRRAMPVSEGTYARELERHQRKAGARPLRPVDALDGFRTLDMRLPMAFPSPSKPPTTPVIGLKHPSSGGFVDGRPKIRGRGILAALEAKGVTLTLAGVPANGKQPTQLSMDRARLIVSTPGGRYVAPDLRGLIEATTALLLGYLAGTPRLCEVHPGTETPSEAWTVLLGGALACEECATGGSEGGGGSAR